MNQLIRLPQVLQRVGFSKAKLYKLIAADQFPQPIKFSSRLSCWEAGEVDQWIIEKILERDSISKIPSLFPGVQK